MPRITPDKKYEALPCSYVGAGCAYENLFKKPFTAPLPEGYHDDGYLSLDNMNRFIRQYLPVKKKLYYNRANRFPLSQLLEQNKTPMIICVKGHCIYANHGDYASFFENKNDPVVCIWYLDPNH